MDFLRNLFGNFVITSQMKQMVALFLGIVALLILQRSLLKHIYPISRIKCIKQRNQIKEHLSIFGSSKSRTKVNIENEVINKFIRDVSVKQMSKHASATSAQQKISIRGVGGDVVVTDTKMVIDADAALQSVAKTMKSDETKKRMRTMLDQAISVENAAESGFGSILSGASKSEVDIEAKNRVVNDTMTKLTDEQLDECIATASTTQDLIIEDVGGSVVVQGFEMEATAKAQADCLSDKIIKNIEDIGVESGLSQDVDSENISKAGGLEDVFAAIGDIFTGPLLYLLIAGIVGAVLITIILIVLMARGGSAQVGPQGVSMGTGGPQPGFGAQPMVDPNFGTPTQYVGRSGY
jgi:hypothetical protein